MKIIRKRLWAFVGLVLLGSMFVACHKDDEDPVIPEPVQEYYEIVSGSQQQYTIAGIKSRLAATATEGIALDNIPALFMLATGSHEFDSLGVLLNSTDPYSTLVMRYPSVDANGSTLWLSGRLYFRCDDKGNIVRPDHILLANRHTICHRNEAPSADYNLEALFANQGALVVVPDLIGFGATVGLPHPYCVSDLNARNAVDMLRAVKHYLADAGLWNDTLKVYNEGYSQGGNTSLAVARYMQTGARGEFNLANSYCGGGPYSISQMVEDYIANDYTAYPIGIPYVLIGLKYAYPEIMKQSYYDYLSPAMASVNITDSIVSKNYTTTDIHGIIARATGHTDYHDVKPSEVLSSEIYNPSSDVYTQSMEAAERCDLARGWQPETPVHFFHDSTDGYVSFVNFTTAQRNIANANTYFEINPYSAGLLSTMIESHPFAGLIFYFRIVMGEYRHVYTSSSQAVRRR